MKMIGFDLDGVLIPDCDRFPNIGGLDEFYALTTNMIPIFSPLGEYVIITARPAEHRSTTVEWARKYLNPMPSTIYHEIGVDSETPGQYKARILNGLPDVHLYVESDPSIVKYLRRTVITGCKIAHFAEYLQSEFS